MKYNPVIKRGTVLIFILLLVIQAVHVFEEIINNAYFISSFYGGLNNFLIAMSILWLIPLILLYGVFSGKKIAYYLSFVYITIIIIDGLDHLIRNYAGLYTGILFIIIGPTLALYLLKELKNLKGSKN